VNFSKEEKKKREKACVFSTRRSLPFLSRAGNPKPEGKRKRTASKLFTIISKEEKGEGEGYLQIILSGLSVRSSVLRKKGGGEKIAETHPVSFPPRERRRKGGEGE